MIKLLLRAVVVSVIAGLAIAAVALGLAPTVAPVIDSIPQPTRSFAPTRTPIILDHIVEKIFGLPVRI